jgi:hypothetical protein
VLRLILEKLAWIGRHADIQGYMSALVEASAAGDAAVTTSHMTADQSAAQIAAVTKGTSRNERKVRAFER